MFFSELIKRLGIEDAVKAKAVISPQGFTGEFVASGQAQVAVQQLSELHAVAGLGRITPFPADAQSLTVFTAASCAGSGNACAFEAFIAELTSVKGRSRLEAVGLTPAGSRSYVGQKH